VTQRKNPGVARVYRSVLKKQSRMIEKKKARRFLPSAAPTIPTGGKGYSTCKL